MAIPSIALIPSGYKANKLYSVLPTNGDGDFTFARTSVATRVNKSGLIEEVLTGIPRLDYSDGACPSLLLEPTATNLVLTSDSGNYGSAPASETLTISPDGTNNAVIPTPNVNSNRYQQDITGVTYATNTLLTYSWYRKRISTPVTSSYVGDLHIKTLVNLTISEATKQIESDINGFDRFQVVVQITDGALASTFRAYFGSIVGVGNSSIAYFGHQYEVGSYATSLINTVGISLTRAVDTATGSGDATVINSTEGVLYFEGSVSVNDANKQIRIANSSVSLNSITLEFRDNGTTLRTYIFDGDATNQFLSNTTIDPNIYNKICLKYKENDCALYLNGVEVASDLLGTMPSGLDLLNFDNTVGGTPFYGKAKDVRIYTTALSDAELTTLTTI